MNKRDLNLYLLYKFLPFLAIEWESFSTVYKIWL